MNQDKIKKNTCSFLVGLIFALGLGISGMTNPKKVRGFLDLFGAFDPSLIFVMGGAILVHFFTYRYIIKKRNSPIFHHKWQNLQNEKITPALIIGSFIFGIGWALGGFCPGPAIASLSSFKSTPLIFVISMIVGMLFFKWLNRFLKLRL